MLAKLCETAHAWPHMIKGVNSFFVFDNNFASGHPSSLKEGKRKKNVCFNWTACAKRRNRFWCFFWCYGTCTLTNFSAFWHKLHDCIKFSTRLNDDHLTYLWVHSEIQCFSMARKRSQRNHGLNKA